MSDPREHVINAFQSYFTKDLPSQVDVPAALKILDAYNLFGKNNSTNQSCINFLNKYLNSSQQRLEGLIILNQIVLQSTTDLYLTNVQKWLQILLSILEGYNTQSVYGMCCKVIGNILAHTKSFPELHRDLSTSFIQSLIMNLLKAKDLHIQAATECLSICMKTFPGVCSSFEDKLHKFFEKELLSPSVISDDVLRCYILLCQCGGKGSGGDKHTKSWSCLCDKLLRRITHILDLLFQDIEMDKKQSNNEDENMGFLDLPTGKSDKIMLLTHYFETFTKCLRFLLTEDFPVSVKVPVEDLLHIICRVLAVHGSSLLQKPLLDRILLASFLPTIHQSAFYLLESVILCCKRNLIMYASIINKLFIQTLSWSHVQDVTYGQTKPLASLRTSVYQVMVLWLQVLGASCDINAVEADLITEIISDVSAPVDQMKLEAKPSGTSQEGPTPPKKKRRHFGYHEISHGISTQRKINVVSNGELVLSALKALQCIISTSGVLMKSSSVKKVYEFVLSTLVNIQDSPHVPPIPYGDIECRKELYSLLSTCVTSNHPSVPSILQCAVGFLKTGCQDSSLKVSVLCRQSLNICESIIHPRSPSLRGPSIKALELNICVNGSSQDQEQSHDTENSQETSVFRRVYPFIHPHTDSSNVSNDSTERLDNSSSVMSSPVQASEISGKCENISGPLSSSQILNDPDTDTMDQSENLAVPLRPSEIQASDISVIQVDDEDSPVKKRTSSGSHVLKDASSKSSDNLSEEKGESFSVEEAEDNVLEISSDSLEIIDSDSADVAEKTADNIPNQSAIVSSKEKVGVRSGDEDEKMIANEVTDINKNNTEDLNPNGCNADSEENSKIEDMLSCFVDDDPDSED